MKIYFTNAGTFKSSIKKVAEIALKHLLQPSEQLEMSVSVVTAEEIKKLNAEYRQIDAVTDVLSFPTLELGKKVVDISTLGQSNLNPQTNRLNLGDVIICLQQAKVQASEYGHSLKREMCFLVLHGLLHLLGYDHENAEDETEMTALQAEILQQAGIER